MSKAFSEAKHDKLLHLLSKSDFTKDYLAVCARFPEHRSVIAPRLDLSRVSEIFEEGGVQSKLIKKYKVFEFDQEDVCGWSWHGSLVVKRQDVLEPMFEGSSRHADEGVGSTMLDVAAECGALMHPPLIIEGCPRPKFDGDMRTMERMIPELMRLFRSVKDVIRQHWDDAGAAMKAAE